MEWTPLGMSRGLNACLWRLFAAMAIYKCKRRSVAKKSASRSRSRAVASRRKTKSSSSRARSRSWSGSRSRSRSGSRTIRSRCRHATTSHRTRYIVFFEWIGRHILHCRDNARLCAKKNNVVAISFAIYFCTVLCLMLYVFYSSMIQGN